MNKIVRKEQFSEKVFLFEIEAPLIAKSRKAGNFVIVRVDQKGERMPLTIAGADIDKGTIILVVQMVGLSSKKLCALNVGDSVVVGTSGQTAGMALLMGFGLPLILLLAVLAVMLSAGAGEGSAALAALCALVPYYILLWSQRHRIARKIAFSIE